MINVIKNIASAIGYRLYEDCLMPSRLNSYESYLVELLDRNYTFLTVENFARRVKSNDHLPVPCALLRHDIDTGIGTARQMFCIEHALGIKSSYYFRLSTVDVGFMQEIAAKGSEASYHFEEIATVAKKYGLRSKA